MRQERFRKRGKLHSCSWSKCKRVCKTHGGLTRHKRIHTSERPFFCPWIGCDKRFPSASELTSHKGVHSEKRPFACPQRGYGKSYKRSSSLGYHKAVAYAGRKPCFCLRASCGRRFSMPYNLQKHMEMHDTEKTLGCATCNKDFRMKADLEDHVCRKHPEVATHSFCPSCQGKFPKEIAKVHVENCSLREDKILNLKCAKAVGCTESTDGFHLMCEKHRGNSIRHFIL